MNPEPQTPLRSFFAKLLTIRQYVTGSSASWGVLAIAVATSIVLMTGTASPTNVEPEDASPGAALRVRTVRIERVREFQQSRLYTGSIVPRRTSSVGFERSARVVEILVDEGDEIVADAPIARLDTRHLETRQAELRALRAEASAMLAELVAGPRSQTIAAARAKLADLEAQVELQSRTRARTEKLLTRRAAAQQQLDDARFAHDSMVARRAAAKERLHELEEGTRQERIAAQRARVDRLDAQLDDLAIDIEDSTLLAPYAGRVAERLSDEGKVVAPGEPILRIVESSALEARIGLPPATASRLSRRQEVDVIVNGQSWPATVDDMLPEVDPSTRTRLVIFRLDPVAAGDVVPGEIVRVEIAEIESTDGFWVPTAALIPGMRGLWSVLAVVDGETERRDVEVLHTEAERTLVRGALSDGDRIVASGTQRVVPGQQVTVTSEPR